MKAFVRFEGHNAGDYWGQRMVVVDSADKADYELLLQDKDKLVMDPELGTLLVRGPYGRGFPFSMFFATAYAARGYQTPQPMPPEVRQALQILISLGYTGYLPK